MTDLINKNKDKQSKKGFTLPEIIVSFSVLVLVIVSATNVLTLVIRTNNDNVDSMLAYGLAQEGVEGMRFMRDSDAVLGLQFDGSVKNDPTKLVWGEKFFDAAGGGEKKFILVNKTPVDHCLKDVLADCMPIGLKDVSSVTDADMSSAPETQVYLSKGASASDKFQYLQTSAGAPGDAAATQFHRVIVVQPGVDKDAGADLNTMRVSSLVFWTANGGIEKKVVLTSDLTNWK